MSTRSPKTPDNRTARRIRLSGITWTGATVLRQRSHAEAHDSQLTSTEPPPPDYDDEDDGDDDDDDGQTSSEEGSEEESDADEIEGAEEAKGKFDIDDADDPEMSKPDISKTARKSRLTVAPRSGSAAVSTASASAPPPPDSGRGRNVSYAVSCEVLQVRGWCATEKVRRTTPESAERPRHLNAAPPDCHANR